MGCHFILQGSFLTQESNLGLLHCTQILYRLSYEGSLKLTNVYSNKVYNEVVFSVFAVLDREGNGTPLQYSFLENPLEGGAW